MALLDIDEFATINDLLEKKIGDSILYELANKLKAILMMKNTIFIELKQINLQLLQNNITKMLMNSIHFVKYLQIKSKESLLIDEDEIDINIQLVLLKEMEQGHLNTLKG